MVLRPEPDVVQALAERIRALEKARALHGRRGGARLVRAAAVRGVATAQARDRGGGRAGSLAPAGGSADGALVRRPAAARRPGGRRPGGAAGAGGCGALARRADGALG